MDDFHGLVAETVNTQHRQCFAMKQNFQHAHPFAGNLRPGQVLEESLAHIIGHLGFGQFLLGSPNATDTRNGVNSRGHIRDLAHFVTSNGSRTKAPLVVGGTGQ